MSVGSVGRDQATEAFFDATAEGVFLLRRCPEMHLSRPQVRQCDVCASTDLSWAPASGGARVVSWAVVPGREGREAITVAVGELDEGPWWWSRLSGGATDGCGEGSRLRIAFERADGGEAVPVFVLEPVDG